MNERRRLASPFRRLKTDKEGGNQDSQHPLHGCLKKMIGMVTQVTFNFAMTDVSVELGKYMLKGWVNFFFVPTLGAKVCSGVNERFLFSL
jgi:hypothetical protein